MNATSDRFVGRQGDAPLSQFEPIRLLGFASILYLLAFCKFSPSSKSTKAWSIFYGTVFALYTAYPAAFKATTLSVRAWAWNNPISAIITAIAVGIPLRYLQQKFRYARINAIKMKYGFTEDPDSWKDMTVEQAQEIETNMAEWEFPRLWQFGWISDFFRTSTDPAVSRVIGNSGHFINEDKKVEHQRMQATVHLMTAFVAYKVKSKNHSLVVARINEHHHRYGIKINSDDVLYLMIHFGLAPVPWINRFGWRPLEKFEIHAIWTLWRENACRMGVKYIPETLEQAMEWRANFEKTFRWREDANEKMALAMLYQVLYPVPSFLKAFVAKVFVSIVDWDIVYYCQMEKLGPSPVIREIAFDFFRLCAFMIRNFGLPRLSAYQRSPQTSGPDGKMVFGHTPYDTMPYWQERSMWNLYGPRALFYRLILGTPAPSAEYESEGVRFEAMGAPHPYPKTQAAIEKKVLANAAVLEDAPYGFRPAIGFQANRLMAPVDGPEYGSDMNRFPIGTPTTPANVTRFTRAYERRGGVYANIETVDKPEDVSKSEVLQQGNTAVKIDTSSLPTVTPIAAAPVVSVAA